MLFISFTADTEIKQAISEPHTAYLEKPFTNDKLVAALGGLNADLAA